MINRFQSGVIYIQLKISFKFMSWTTSWYFKWGIDYQFDHINHFDWTAQTLILECTSIYFIITYYELEKLVRFILTGAIFDQITSKGMTSVATKWISSTNRQNYSSLYNLKFFFKNFCIVKFSISNYYQGQGYKLYRIWDLTDKLITCQLCKIEL